MTVLQQADRPPGFTPCVLPWPRARFGGPAWQRTKHTIKTRAMLEVILGTGEHCETTQNDD